MIWREVGIRNSSILASVSCNQDIVVPTPTALNYSLCALEKFQSLKQQFTLNKTIIQQVYRDWDDVKPRFELLDATFENFKGDQLAKLKSSQKNIVTMQSYHSQNCEQYVTLSSTDKTGACVAVVHSSSLHNAALLQRFNADQKKTGRKLDPVTPKSSGYFRNVAKKKGRESQITKTRPLFEHLEEIQTEFTSMLARRDLGRGDDLVLMVANDGEIDLFLNFACSCRKNGISLHNVVLIAGSRWVWCDVVCLVWRVATVDCSDCTTLM